MLTTFLIRIWGSLRTWHDCRATIRALSALDDRLLRDIELERNQIRSYVDGELPSAAAEQEHAIESKCPSLSERERYTDAMPGASVGSMLTRWPLGLPAGHRESAEET